MALQAYSLARDGSTALSPHFCVREFRCKDGSDPVFIDTALAELLERIREHFGKPVTITSAYRTPAHNAKAGGAKFSQHLYGRAADIRVQDVSVEDAPQVILGYTIANDATARDAMTGGPWSRGKSFDSACPLGPWITVDPALDVTNLAIRSYLNGEIAQDSSTAHMIWNPFELVSYVSHQMTLLPGDVIATGAPAGAGLVDVGDRVEIEIEGIGRLTNPVVRA